MKIDKVVQNLSSFYSWSFSVNPPSRYKARKIVAL